MKYHLFFSRYYNKIIKNFTFEDANKGNMFYKIFKNSILFLRFVFRNLRYLKFFSIYVFKFFDTNYIFNLNTFNNQEFIDNIKKGKSLIRFGDGEIALMRDIDIHFQVSDEKLRQSLWQIVNSYDNANFMLTLNNFMLSKSNKYLKSRGLIRLWLPMKVMFDLYFDKKQKYGDTEMFYFKDYFKDYIFPIIANKKMIFVSKKDNIDKIKNSIIAKSYNIYYICTRDTNSFEDKNIIKSQIDSIINSNKKQDFILLPACGPLSKVLSFEYSNIGLQSLDIGHGIEIAFNSQDYSDKTLR